MYGKRPVFSLWRSLGGEDEGGRQMEEGKILLNERRGILDFASADPKDRHEFAWDCRWARGHAHRADARYLVK